jgi:hypothetical protein
MTTAIQRFIELERKKSEVKKFFDELKSATEELAKEIGIGGFFQDDEGIVYSIVEPEGRYVNYEKVSYVRTKRPGEVRGTLSVKEAEAKGFTVK